jgi:hypothetical protein
MEELPGCQCTVPGFLLKCSDCQHYQAMMASVEQRVPQLQNLTEQQLDAIIEEPDFYKRDMNRYSPQVNSENSGERSHLHIGESSTKTQLSLFDDNETD